MSHTNRFSTTMTDPIHLANALAALGFAVEQYAMPQPMEVYSGALSASAEIIIRKETMRQRLNYTFGDIGFARKADGTFELVGDGTNIERLNMLQRNSTFAEAVGQRYAEEEKKLWATSQGYIFQGRTEVDVDGHMQINLLYAVRD